MINRDELAAVWPDGCELTELDVQAVEDLAGAMSRLSRSLGIEGTCYLLTQLGGTLWSETVVVNRG